jgi:ribosomal protein S18 acetylase RimI-like enzyme
VATTPPDDVLVHTARAVLERDGSSGFVLGDLSADDLGAIAWSGDPHHLSVVRAALDRVVPGEFEYLTLRLPDGRPVAKACLDFTRFEDAGYLSQLATHPDLQGMGLGTRLMAGAEERIVARGRSAARIGVEHDNTGARALYERLGYRPVGEDVEHWGRTGPDGTVVMHRAEVTLLRKPLA